MLCIFFLQRKGRERKKKPGRVILQQLVEASVFHCQYCSFWSRELSFFHDHVLGHGKTPAFRCSVCSQQRKTRSAIDNHIKQRKTTDHYNARCIRSVSPPRDEYANQFRVNLVPEKMQWGQFSDSQDAPLPTSLEERNIDSSLLRNPVPENNGSMDNNNNGSDEMMTSDISCSPNVALNSYTDPIQPAALDLQLSWETSLASENLIVLKNFLRSLECSKIDGIFFSSLIIFVMLSKLILFCSIN